MPSPILPYHTSEILPINQHTAFPSCAIPSSEGKPVGRKHHRAPPHWHLRQGSSPGYCFRAQSSLSLIQPTGNKLLPSGQEQIRRWANGCATSLHAISLSA